MSYAVINADNTYEIRPDGPDTDTLLDLIDGVPEMLRTGHPSIVMWVSDDFLDQHARGDAQRNVVVTTVAYALGADLPPLCGRVLVTGVTFDPMEGYSATAMAGQDATAMEFLLADINAMLAGGIPDAPHTVLTALQSMIQRARTTPIEPARLTIATVTLDEFLDSLEDRP